MTEVDFTSGKLFSDNWESRIGLKNPTNTMLYRIMSPRKTFPWTKNKSYYTEAEINELFPTGTTEEIRSFIEFSKYENNETCCCCGADLTKELPWNKDTVKYGLCRRCNRELEYEVEGTWNIINSKSSIPSNHDGELSIWWLG